jgi:protein SCO1/2
MPAFLRLISALWLSLAAALFEPAKPGVVVPELAVGETFPAADCHDQTGALVRLADFHGQALALTFIYTRCPMGTFCPLVSRNFDVTQELLVKLGLNGRCHLLSLSLDPDHDTAEVLSAYAKSCHADPAIWTFANAPDATIRRLGAAAGLEYKREGERIDHNLRTVVIDPQGRLRHVFRGDAWTPQELAAELRAAAHRQ